MKRLFYSLLLAVVLGILSVFLKGLLPFSERTPLLLMLPVIALTTIYGGKIPGLFATFVTTVIINYFFLFPVGGFSVTQEDIYLSLFYAFEGVFVIYIIESFKSNQIQAQNERERFLTTLKSIDDAVIATDTQGVVNFVNPSALKLIDCQLKSVLGKKLVEVFHVYASGERKKVINPLTKVIKSNKPTHLEEDIYLLSNSGKRYEIDYSVSPILDRNKIFSGTVLTFRDISQRKFIREGMGRIASIVNSSNDAIYSIDLNGKVKTWNQGAEKLFGFSEGEIIGRSLRQFTIPAAKSAEYDKAISNLKKNIPVQPFETIRKAKDGRLLQVLISGSPVFDSSGKVSSVSVVTHNITDRKKMEEKLFVANRRFELATQAVRGLIYDWDLISDTVWRSSGLFNVVGFRPEEVPPKKDWWMSRIHPDDRDKLRGWENLNFKTKGKFTVEYRFLNKDNKYVKLWDHGLVEKDKNGKLVRVIGSAIDFSEKEQEEQRKNEFISMASHELKTPLTSLKVFTQLLQNLFQKNSQAGNLLGKMNEQVDSLTGIVNDMLDVSKIESGRLKLRKINFSLDRLIAETVDMIQATTPTHQIRVKGRLSKNLYADKERLNEVILNLLSNAIKYSPDSDQVEVEVSRKNGSALVRVKDYGVGISQKNLNHVFDRFFRVYGDDKKYPGLGMGLYISSEIIHRHHGKIWVTSKKGGGSTFSFTIPLKNEN